MSLAQWKGISQVIWNCAASIGLILGGIWTISTFQVLGQKTHSEWEVKKLQAEEGELRARIARQSALSADLSAELLTVSDGRQFIATTVTIKNAGNRTAVLDLDHAPINIARLQFRPDASADVVSRTTSHVYVLGSAMLDASGLAILPNETKICKSLAPVTTAGLYLVSFFAYRPIGEERTANMEGKPEHDRAALWPSQYLEVKALKH